MRKLSKIVSGILTLAIVMVGPVFQPEKTAYAAYVNTNMNTFIHDPKDVAIGYPGQEMELRVRVGYNGVNGLNNPNSDEITNVQIRLSNDQSYLNINQPDIKYKKENPYAPSDGSSDGDSANADAWEEGYRSGKDNAYKNKLDYVFPVDGGVYPFEVNQSLFTQQQDIRSLKKGEYQELVFRVNVRSDALKVKDKAGNTSDGYFGVPFTIWYDIPGSGLPTQRKTEFINVFIQEQEDVANPSTPTRDQAFVMGEGQETPSGTYGAVMNYRVDLRNRSGHTLYDVQVKLQSTLAEKATVQLTEAAKSTASKDFPFEINEANYDRVYQSVENGAVISPDYSMAIKSNAASGYYPLHYVVSYKTAPASSVSKTEEYTLFVNIRNTTQIDTESNRGDFKENDRTKARLVVDNYHTEPAVVFAGEPFTLVLSMKNASSAINASNILFSLTSAKDGESVVFTMNGGANSVVVSALAAGQTTELRMPMVAGAGTTPKSYTVTVNEKYDSPEFKNAEEKVEIDVPVNQHPRIGYANFQVLPETITVGQEADVMFGINNTGKVTLYNVQAFFEADSIQKNSLYLGNIKPGETGNVDIMLQGVKATEDDGTIPVKIQYEDVNGNVSEDSTSITLPVTEGAASEDGMGDGSGEMDGMNGEGKPGGGISLPWIPMTAGVLFILGGALFLRRRKKASEKKAAAETENDERN